MEEYMWIVWAALLILSFVVEATTAALVSIWFCGGALFALITSFIPGVPYWVEIIIFVVVSVLSFLLIRPWLSKFNSKRTIRSNVDRILGKRAVVLTDITDLSVGSVKVDGVIWTATIANDAKLIEKDKIVIVKAIEGNKLLVEEIKGE